MTALASDADRASGAMAIAVVLPETTQAPIGWLYLGLCTCRGHAACDLAALGAPRHTDLRQGTSS